MIDLSVNDVEALMAIGMFGILLGLFCLISWVWDKVKKND